MSNLIKNTAFSVITFSSRIISGSVIYIVLARLLNLSDFGLLSFGVTFAGLLSVMAEFGFSLMAQRDIPQKRFDTNKYVFNTLIQKVGLAVIATISGLVYLHFFFEGENVKIGIIFILNAIVTSNNMYLFSVFRATNAFKIESWLSLCYSIIIVGVVLLFYNLNLNVYFIAYGLLFGRLIQLLFSVIFYFRKNNIKLEIDKNIQTYLFKHSFSFGAHYIIGVFYFSIDNQLIAYYSGNESLAIYQAIFKIVLIFLSANALLEGVFLPFLSAKFNNTSSDFNKLATLINKVILTIGLLLFVIFSLFVKDLVAIFYSEKYLISLSIALPLSFILLTNIITTVYSVLLTLSDHQDKRVLIVFISLIVNVSLNFIFIPRYGYIGAAYVSLITHFILATLYIMFAFRYQKSFLVTLDIVIFATGTVILVLLKNIYNIQINFIHSIMILLGWSVALLLIYRKRQLLDIKNLITKGY